jgi:glycosyltransferase involved in cell wall biosynthesis
MAAGPSEHHGRPVRLVYCVDSFRIGGTELNAVRTVAALDRNRFDIRIVHLQDDGPLRAHYEAMGIPLVHLPIARLYSPGTASQGVKLARMLRQWCVDIVHTHDLYTNIFATPWARVLSDCRVIASRRWWYDAPRAGLTTLNRWSYRFAHCVLANSAGVASLLSTQEHIPARKIVQIPNFLEERAFARADDEARSRQRAQWQIPPGAFVVGSVARLAPVKNHALLLRAAAVLGSNVHVVLIGDGPSRAELEKLALQLNIQGRVHFFGEVMSTGSLHTMFDVSVLCSLSEGFPNSVIEAMAAARPVIATPVGGVLDVVQEGQTGLLVPTDQPERLAHAIRTLQEDPALYTRLARAGERLARERFHQDVVITRLSSMYAAMASDRTRSSNGEAK